MAWFQFLIQGTQGWDSEFAALLSTIMDKRSIDLDTLTRAEVLRLRRVMNKTSVELDQALARFESGEPLTDREVGALLRSGRVDRERWEDLAEHKGPYERIVERL